MSSATSNQEWPAASQVRAAWSGAYQSRRNQNHEEAVKAAFLALENVDEFVSPEIARSVQATINRIRKIGRDYGLLTEEIVRSELDLTFGDVLPRLFSVTYREQKLYPAFLFESSSDKPGKQRVRPVVAELGKLADKYEWDDSSVAFWLVTPSTWFAPGDLPVDHINDTSRLLIAFESSVGVQW